MAREGSRGNNTSLIVKAGNWLSGTIAAAATFALVGPFYGATVDTVASFAHEQYGPTTSEVVSYLWGPFAALLLFVFLLTAFIVGLRAAVFWLREFYG